MVTVSEKAQEMIKKVLESRKDDLPVRLVYAGGGCSGPSLGMSLDEAREGDKIFKEDDITFVIDEQLFEQAKPITIDFIDSIRGSGFSITSNLPVGAACSACGGGCG
jgi:iron-sulfur cluster assembly accessory protein